MIAIWWCLEPECQKKLKQYQEDVYGFHLQIPQAPNFSNIYVETLEQIDKLMRQAPQHQKRVK